MDIEPNESALFTAPLRDLAFRELIRVDIHFIEFMRRATTVKRLVERVFIPSDAVFAQISHKTILHTFYNDFNRLLKLDLEDSIDDETLSDIEQAMYDYVKDTGLKQQVVFSHADDS